MKAVHLILTRLTAVLYCFPERVKHLAYNVEVIRSSRKSLAMEIRLDGGYVIPTADMGLTGTIAVGDGTIEITDVYGQKSKFETVFEGGFLYYMEDGERMMVCISTDGLLHIQFEAMALTGTAEGENPTVQNGVLNMNASTMEATVLNQYYERAQ